MFLDKACSHVFVELFQMISAHEESPGVAVGLTERRPSLQVVQGHNKAS